MALAPENIRGVNLGGWLMMEGYILGGRNIAERRFKAALKASCGARHLEEFEEKFRDTFITEEDFKNISLMKATAVRVPFNARLIERRPRAFSEEGFRYLDRAFSWGRRYGVGVILDLHAACGPQNEDWHSDSDLSLIHI